MAAVEKLDARGTEKIFYDLLDKGVDNFREMEADVLKNVKPIEMDLLVNFKDLVNLCIDLKRKEKFDQVRGLQRQQQQQQQQSQQTDQLQQQQQPEKSMAPSDGAPPAKKKR